MIKNRSDPNREPFKTGRASGYSTKAVTYYANSKKRFLEQSMKKKKRKTLENKRSQEWWDNWFIGLAKYISTASKDKSTKVGAVIVDENRRVISTGYNGFPANVEDSDERLDDREKKYKIVVHSEMNSILFSQRSLVGNTIYVWPFQPCSSCAGAIIQTGITRVVAPFNDNPRWIESFKLAEELFNEAGVELTLLKENNNGN